MKKILLLLALFSLVALFVSCNKEDVTKPIEIEEIVPPTSPITFIGYTEQGDDSKTVLHSDYSKVKWCGSESINIFYQGKSYQFTSPNLATPQDYTNFSGTIPGVSDVTSLTENAYALYPYNPAATINTTDNKIKTFLPNVQTAKVGSFDTRLAISVGTAKNATDIQFKNVCSGVYFSVAHSGIKSVVLRSESQTPLAGVIHIDVSNNPTINFTLGGASDNIIVKAPNGGTFTPGERYYIVVLPGEHTGITMEAWTDNNYYARGVSRSIKFERSQMMNALKFDEGIAATTVKPFYYYGTANCLLLKPTENSGTLNIAAYKTNRFFEYTGTSAESTIPRAHHARVIWEESVGFITGVPISGDNMTVNKRAGVYGNALVGIYDASNKLLWSYHIWAPEVEPTTLNYNKTLSGNTYQVLDLPIGATKKVTASSSDEDKAKGIGCYYQWGRKDPLGRPQSVTADAIKPVYDKDGNQILLSAYITSASDIKTTYTSEATDGPLSHFMASYAITHPMEFITNEGAWTLDDIPYLWGNPYRADDSFSILYVSNSYKSIFDPSPEGYKVPMIDTWHNFSIYRSDEEKNMNVVGNENFNWTNSTFDRDHGYSFYYQEIGKGATHFYPNGGLREGKSANFKTDRSAFWANGSSTYYNTWLAASALFIKADRVVPNNTGIVQAAGAFVLCVKE